MDSDTTQPSSDALRAFGFVVIRRFFDAVPLADEIDRVLQRCFQSQPVTPGSARNFQYVPMMTAETPVSLSLLDQTAALAEVLLGAPVLPTRAKGTRYFGNTHWHTDSELPITSIGILAYFESLHADDGALRVVPGSHHPELGNAIKTLGPTVESAIAALPPHVIETEPGDIIVMDEHLFHASSGSAIRRQWRVDYLPAPADADAERQTRTYFEHIYQTDWDGGYDVDLYPSYGTDWKRSGRPSVAQLERLGVYDLADRQEAFTRSRKRSRVDR